MRQLLWATCSSQPSSGPGLWLPLPSPNSYHDLVTLACLRPTSQSMPSSSHAQRPLPRPSQALSPAVVGPGLLIALHSTNCHLPLNIAFISHSLEVFMHQTDEPVPPPPLPTSYLFFLFLFFLPPISSSSPSGPSCLQSSQPWIWQLK